MKNLYHYLSNIEKSRTSLQEGQSIDFVLNEEYSIRTDIVAVDGRDVYVGLDRRAYELLERAGVMELAGDAGYKGSQGTSLGGTTKPVATTQANAPVAKPVTKPTAAAPNSGSSYTGPIGTATNNPAPKKAAKAAPYKGSTSAQSIAQASGVKDVNKIQVGQKLTLPGGGSYTVQKGDTMDKIAKQTGGKAAAPQGDQTAGGKTNADFLPGAAGGARPDAMTGADAGNQTSSGYNAQSQAQKPPADAMTGADAGNQTSSGYNAQSQAQKTPDAAAPATAKSSLPITTTGGPTAANPASVNPPTQGGPAVTGGFGQQTNISQDSDDVIAKRTPYGQQNQATKSYSSVGDFAGAVGNKLKNTFGGGSAPAAPAAPASPPPATIEEAPRELDRVLQLAGVKRG